MENNGSDAEYYGKIAYEIYRGPVDNDNPEDLSNGVAWKALSEDERERWVSIGGFIQDMESGTSDIFGDIKEKLKTGELTPGGILAGIKRWMSEIEKESWVFLANAAFVESSKDAIRHLMALVEFQNPPQENAESQDEDQDVVKTSLGNYLGKIVNFPTFGEGEIIAILPPNNAEEVERVRIKFKDGKVGEFGFRPINPNISTEILQ